MKTSFFFGTVFFWPRQERCLQSLLSCVCEVPAVRFATEAAFDLLAVSAEGDYTSRLVPLAGPFPHNDGRTFELRQLSLPLS